MAEMKLYELEMLRSRIYHGEQELISTLTLEQFLSLIHISEPTRQAEISYAVFCLKKKNNIKEKKTKKHMNSLHQHTILHAKP